MCSFSINCIIVKIVYCVVYSAIRVQWRLHLYNNQICMTRVIWASLSCLAKFCLDESKSKPLFKMCQRRRMLIGWREDDLSDHWNWSDFKVRRRAKLPAWSSSDFLKHLEFSDAIVVSLLIHSPRCVRLFWIGFDAPPFLPNMVSWWWWSAVYKPWKLWDRWFYPFAPRCF